MAWFTPYFLAFYASFYNQLRAHVARRKDAWHKNLPAAAAGGKKETLQVYRYTTICTLK